MSFSYAKTVSYQNYEFCNQANYELKSLFLAYNK